MLKPRLKVRQKIRGAIFAVAILLSWDIGVGQENTGLDESNWVGKPTLDELLLFYPAKFPVGDWQPTDLGVQDVFFSAEDGTKLHGWYCPVEKPRCVVLMMHGNAGNITTRVSFLRYLQKIARVSVFIFDYRGFGRSEGTATVDGAVMDAEAAWIQVAELASVRKSDVVLMGESLGGAIAVRLASESSCRGLVLQSTFSSLRKVAELHYPQLAWLVSRNKLNSKAAISRHMGPTLISHGTADRTIHFECSKELFAAANEPRQLVMLKDVGHNNWLNHDYCRALDRFFSTLPGDRKR
jgi:fermentation-respiration switch protein FrsA (DUF1100 family)